MTSKSVEVHRLTSECSIPRLSVKVRSLNGAVAKRTPYENEFCVNRK